MTLPYGYVANCRYLKLQSADDKTTLALMAWAPERLTSGGRPFRPPLSGSPSHAYVTFDDAVTRKSADTDSTGFVADLPERVIAAASVGAVRTPGFFDIARLPRLPVRMQV